MGAAVEQKQICSLASRLHSLELQENDAFACEVGGWMRIAPTPASTHCQYSLFALLRCPYCIPRREPTYNSRIS